MGRILLFGITCAVVIIATGMAATGTPQVVAKIETGAGPARRPEASATSGSAWAAPARLRALTRPRIPSPIRSRRSRALRRRDRRGQRLGRRYGTHSVIRMDLMKLKVVKRIILRDQIWDVAFGAGSVWATETYLYVVRIDPRTNKVGRKIKIPDQRARHLRYGAGAVWVGSLLAGASSGSTRARTSSQRSASATCRVRSPCPTRRSGSRFPLDHGLADQPEDAQGVATIRVASNPKTPLSPTTGPSSCRVSA